MTFQDLIFLGSRPIRFYIWLWGIVRVARTPPTDWRAVIIGGDYLFIFFPGMQMSNLSEDRRVAAAADGH